MTEEFIQIVTTAASQESAKKIAHALLEQRLAACVQIVGPVKSIYRWKGQIETAAEWQCWIKTRRAKYEPAAQVIRQHHTYELPEILALPIVEGSEAYLRWLASETS
ncbi:MAG TPA: divalent-cation tolerance protein CutA [Pirellulales bacterium]|nr:divalent-cation tolerance protein CutA [Pirellulales bacterium]